MEDSSIDEKSLDKLRYKELSKNLMAELNLKDSPVAIKFFYTEAEFVYFKKRNDFCLSTEAMTFCQSVKAARNKEQPIYSELKDLSCGSAAYGFNWKEGSDIRSSTKQYLNKGVFGIALAPLGDARFIADTVNVCCDKQQAETLIGGWTEASGVPAWRPETAEDLSSCSCTVYVHNKNLASIGPICPTSCDENEANEMNVILPADHLKHTVDQLLSGTLNLKSSSFNRPGDGVFRYILH